MAENLKVVVCGATTSVCVEGTARDAFAHDYYTVLPTVCASDVRRDWHEASPLLMEPRVDEVTSDEVIAAWDISPGHSFAVEPRSDAGRRA